MMGPRYRLSRAGLLLVALCAVAAAGLPPRSAGAKVFDPQTFTLANGMQVVVIENHRVPVVTHMVWYKVGGLDEPQGRSGMAHLLEHLMFKGTQTRAPGEFSAIVARNGGEENAFTSHDFTGFYQNVAKDRLELMMSLEADRMRNLKLTDAQVAPEKQVVLEERHQRVDNSPGALLAEQADAVQFFNTNYKRPVIGWEEEVRALTAEEVLTFYRQWYHPGNAVLVVAGDVTAEEVGRLAQKTYGAIAASPKPEHLALTEPKQRAARRVVMRDDRVVQPSWSRSYLAPSYQAGAVEHAYALQVLAEIVGGGPTSRLYRALVLDGQMAVSAQAWYDPLRRGPSVFAIHASPRQRGDVDAVETAVDQVIAGIVADGVSDAELARAKRRMLAESIYARDSLRTGAQLLGKAYAIGMDAAVIENWPDRIEAVSKSDVDAAARMIFDPDTSVTAILLAAETATRAAVQ